MSSSTITRILLIDDLEMNNIISSFTIKKLFPAIEIVSFTEPLEGLVYIKESYQQCKIPMLMLLDINMPILNGWEVLDILNLCSSELTEHLNIYILSSSIDPRDKKRAMDAPKVLGFFERPLTAEMVQRALSEIEHRSVDDV